MKIKSYFLSICLIFSLFACKSNGIKEGTNESLPNEKPIIDVELSILTNVNSTQIVRDSVLKVFESAFYDSEGNAHEPVLLNTLEIKGKTVQLQLKNGKHYDFVAEGNDVFAASAIKNLKIKSDLTKIVIIQLEKRLPNRKAKLPELTSFYAELQEGRVELKDGVSLPLPLNAKIQASLFTHGGASQKMFSRDFATKLGLGCVPSSLKLSNHPFLSGIEPSKSEIIEKNSGWQNNFRFDIIGHNMGAKEEVDFVLVCYDVAGNRLEHHTIVHFAPSKYKAYPKDDVKFVDLKCNIKSTHSFMHLYSKTNPSPISSNIRPLSIDGKNTYYFPNFSFNVRREYATEILGMQLFRRCKEGIDEPFLKVSEVLYNRGKLGTHIITDTYGALQIGKIYEYKIRALFKEETDNVYYVDSPLLPIKMILPFEAELLSPSNHKVLTSLDEFSFKITSHSASTQDIFSANNADYFVFGLLIRSFDSEPVFWNTFKYWMDEKHVEDEKLELSSSGGKFRSLKELKIEGKILYEKTWQNLVNIDEETGTVKIKKDALKFTNNKPLHHYHKCLPYYWDIAFCKLANNGSGIEATPCAFFKENQAENITVTASSHAHIVLPTSCTNNGAFSFTVDDRKDNAGIITPSYIVKIKDSTSLDFLKSFNAKVVDSLKISAESDETYYNISSSSNKDILPSLLSSKDVISAEYDSKIELIENIDIDETPIFPFSISTSRSAPTPLPLNDPLLRSVCYSLDVTNAFKAYKDLGFGEHKVMVAIMDTGVNEGHEDLYLNGASIIKKFDNDVFDGKGHGTHCAGIIAGVGNNNLGIAGVSWKMTELFVMKISANTFEIYKKALDFIKYVKDERIAGRLTQKTIPLNMSFGSPYPSLFTLEMIELALKAGILPIVAMGNSGSALVNYPAAYPGVVAVGSSNAKNEVSYFSSKGEHISLVAPGEAIISLGKDFSDDYKSMHGTSMATPFVCGTVAYLMSFNPELTPLQVKTILETSADKIENDDDFNTRRGYGRINVYEAAKLAKSTEGVQNKFFKGSVNIQVLPHSAQNIISIYSEKGICVFFSQPKADGKLTIKGLLPGKYKVHLNQGIQIKRREFELFAGDENDVNVVF